jgi:hypothetical protein
VEENVLFSEMVKKLNGKILWNPESKKMNEYSTVCATDMLSELLAIGKDGTVLLTGLCTPQMMNTADIVGIGAVIIVRGKNVPLSTIKKAQELEIPVAVTNLTMFSTCGILFCSDLKDVNGTGKG